MTSAKQGMNDGGDEAGRIQRLEEAVGFSEHTIEQLNEQVLALSARLEQLVRRLAATEARLAKLTEAAPPVDEPDES